MASLAALAAGCAVGPDYHRPAAPETQTYEDRPLPAETASADTESGAAQKFAPGKEIPAEWWALFHSESLNRLIMQAIKANPDLEAAQAALREAGENAAAAGGVLFPTVSAGFSSIRQKTSGAAAGGNFPGSIYTLHDASVGVSYGLDVFGGARRQVEELEAVKEFQRFQMEAAYLTLAGNVVTSAVQEASLRGQIAATNKIIEDQQKQLDLTQQQFELGGAAKTVVLAQQTILEQTRATLPDLEKQLAQTRHQLSVLMGQLPSTAPDATFELSSLKLPDTLPVSLPSKLVEQRPDVRAADANLHAASAAIGVAVANRLPQITLSAGLGTEANTLGNLFGPGSGIWNFGGSIAQTVFDGGTLAHEQGAAEAAFDVAAAQYRKTVLAAFQDVADTLRALQSDAETLKAQTAAEAAASESLRLAQEQYDDGAINYLVLLNAEQAEQQAELALVRAEAQRYADTAALFQALGGGWWNRDTSIEGEKK